MTVLIGGKEFDVAVFSEIVGNDVVNVIFSKAPYKVLTRVCKAVDHFLKSKELLGKDDEMAVIRLIAAEEELVVAIFELIKVQLPKGGKYRGYVNKFKSHQVKLAFYPVLTQFKYILQNIFSSSVSPEGFEGVVEWNLRLIVVEGKAVARIHFDDSGNYIDHNPMSLVISLEDKSYDEVLHGLYSDFVRNVSEQTDMTLREFVNQRADFRNKILYASDAGVASLGDDLEYMLKETFTPTVHDLLWVICILASYPIDKNADFLLNQFFSLYGRVLKEAKINVTSP